MENISRFGEDEVLPDWNRALLLCLLHNRSVQVFGRLTLLRGTPECFRQSLHLAFCVCVQASEPITRRLAGCNSLVYIYTYFRSVSIVRS